MKVSYVTIGVPVYNEEKTLYKNLESIVASADLLKKPYEIIVCLNGTTDNSPNIALNFQEKYPIKIIKSEKGKPKAIKSITEKAQGEYIIYIDADSITDKNCFKNLIIHYLNPKIKAVTGRPIPYQRSNLLYKILNVRMTYPESEISKRPMSDTLQKPFIHGRIYTVKREIFKEVSSNFQESIGDDTFLTHFIINKYGWNSIGYAKDANVYYQPVQSLGSWWKKWSRIWKDLDLLYKKNQEFLKLKPYMKTKINWNYVNTLPLNVQFCFIVERMIHHIGHIYFNLIKNNKKIGWIRLGDTKEIPK